MAIDIAFWLMGLDDPSYPVKQLGPLSIELSEKLRALAIINLLVKGKSDSFHHNLIRSGMVRETYLQRLKKERIDGDHHQASGRYEALLDTIAAGDFDLARRIGDLSPGKWMESHEYEDDYCYAQILHRFVRSDVSEREISTLLDQFETFLEGELNARLGVCRALLLRDQTAFDEAFDALLVEREAKIEADKERGQLEEPHVIAQRQVFVEGLALLRLADRRGLQTQSEYRYCPSLARVPMKMQFPD